MVSLIHGEDSAAAVEVVNPGPARERLCSGVIVVIEASGNHAWDIENVDGRFEKRGVFAAGVGSRNNARRRYWQTQCHSNFVSVRFPIGVPAGYRSGRLYFQRANGGIVSAGPRV